MGNLSNSYASTVSSEYDANKITTLNAMAQILDDCINGLLTINTTGGTTTLTGTPAAPQAQHLMIVITGVLGSNAIIEIPVAVGTGRNRIYAVKNSTTGAFTVTIRVVGGSGVTITQTKKKFVGFNGTDIENWSTEV